MRWAEDAACANTPIEMWFNELGEQYDDTALRMCRGCPVKTECLDYALTRKLSDGIWGGQTPLQREQQIKRVKAKK